MQVEAPGDFTQPLYSFILRVLMVTRHVPLVICPVSYNPGQKSLSQMHTQSNPPFYLENSADAQGQKYSFYGLQLSITSIKFIASITCEICLALAI